MRADRYMPLRMVAGLSCACWSLDRGVMLPPPLLLVSIRVPGYDRAVGVEQFGDVAGIGPHRVWGTEGESPGVAMHLVGVHPYVSLGLQHVLVPGELVVMRKGQKAPTGDVHRILAGV